MWLALGGAACERAPPPGDTARVVVATAPEALDPRFATSAVAGRLAELVACPLVSIGDDLRVKPFLAESIERVDDRTYLVNVRDGVFFHDGTPVTAEDVRFTLLSMKDPALASPHASKLEKLTDVVVEGPRTVRITFREPYGPFLVDLRGYGILSRAACAPDPARCRMRPVGAGPFAVESVEPGGDRIRLVAHDRSPYGRISIRKVDVRVMRDNAARLLAVLDRDVDLVAAEMLPTDLDVIERAPHAKVLTGPGIGFSYLALNTRAGPLADVRVRRALAEAVDVDLLVETKLRGRARRASGLLPDDHWAKDRAVPLVEYDVDHARALLKEAGYADGFSLTILTTSDRMRRALALLYADAWAQIGVRADVRVREWSALYADIQTGAFDAFSAKWTPVVDPDLLDWVFSSTHIPSPARDGAPAIAGGNRSGWRDAEVDAWLARAIASTDDAERAALFAQIEKRVARDVPLVPLWFEDEVAIVDADLRDFRLDRIASLLPLARARLERTKLPPHPAAGAP